MRKTLRYAAFALLLATSAPAQQVDITGTISAQIEAFQANDLAQAFTYASPNIQRYFGSPERFGLMVRQGYPMVWRPTEVQYLDLREVDGALWQTVRLRDQEGAYHVLAYQMIKSGDGWRINGVRFLEETGAGV